MPSCSKVLVAIAGSLLLTAPTNAQTLDPARGVYTLADGIEPALQSVVRVLNYSVERGDRVSSSGSGAVIDGAAGYVLTNNHVVEGASRLQVVLKDGQIIDASLVGVDPATDLALLRVSASGLRSVTIAD